MRIKYLFFTLFLLFQSIFLQAQDNKGTLEITFVGIRTMEGKIAIGINDSPEGWPRTPKMDPNWLKSKDEDGTMTVRVPDLPYGTYAVSALDDVNGNLDMDSFLGMPKEGYGFSRDGKVGMGPPKFEECAFELNEPLMKITIQMRYFKKPRK